MDPIQPNFDQGELQESFINKALKVSMVMLSVLVMGLGGFIVLSINKNKTTLTTTSKAASPKMIPSPTLELDPNNIDIGSIESDLKDIGKDVDSLQ